MDDGTPVAARRQFLASDEAEEVSDRHSPSRCTDLIIGFGCDQDSGRPERMSPAKVQNFMLGWLPRKVLLSRRRPERDAARGRRLDPWTAGTPAAEAGHRQMHDTLFDSMATFSRITAIPPSSA